MLSREADDDDPKLIDAPKDLVEAGLLRPLAWGDQEGLQLWRDMDLCSMVEGAFRVQLDPRRLRPEERTEWRQRLGKEHYLPLRREEYEEPYWLLREGQIAGTLLTYRLPTAWILLSIASLYLLPEHRRLGISERALQALHEAVGRRPGGRGLRLSTHWVWPQAVRYYLQRKFWLFHWKDDVAFHTDRSLPEWRMAIARDEAEFVVQIGGRWERLYGARRAGEWLVLEETELAADRKNVILALHGLSTLSLGLALAGWPLIRSEEAWQKHCHNDFGPPESLAYKIEWWEAIARKDGWVVDTPRIPGIRYRDYQALMANADRDGAEATRE